MKKRILSAVLIFLFLLTPVLPGASISNVGVSASAAASTSKKNSLKLKTLTLSTAKKSNQIKLSWSKVSNAKGYVIFRSTTGKSGSYKKLTTVKGKTNYTDKKLKSSKTYYYAVRAYRVKNGKTTYGPYKYANLSTRPTNAFIAKRFILANEVYIDFLLGFDTDSGEPIMINGEPYKRVWRFSSKKSLRKYLDKYMTSNVYSEHLSYYIEKDGKLYSPYPAYGAITEDRWNVIVKKLGDTSCTFSLKSMSTYMPEFGISEARFKMIFKNGRWVISSGNLSLCYGKNGYDPKF